ncbi:hypothetical protein C1A38_00820 [Verrucosispora sp. ts21]|uniref:hypothetical protein n=1 Tax=Verrucosispora sp. ts21 TaxID=2069341 RepID=UPI000C88DAB4|nr:hypothetical protein [Verrucosispora sp. ts21]PMR62891.1 hypothetical protein C1A38_00820 [Verrucosispora sp. ts21]
MRGGLDETLARMRRREEALRRRSTEPADGESGSADGAPPSSADGRNDGTGWAPHREAGGHVLDDVAEALRAAVAVHPGTAVTARIDHDGQAYDLRVAWTGQEVTVTGQPVAAPPSWPLSANTVAGWPARQETLTGDPAARLAELIRRDPSLLTSEGPPG